MTTSSWSTVETGDVFVVLEDAPDGTWVNVYPAVPYAAK
jgi:hypothetical protein